MKELKAPLRKTLKLTFWIQLFSQPRSATIRNQAVQVDERILTNQNEKKEVSIIVKSVKRRVRRRPGTIC